jgi:hypothetical protein
MQNAGAWQLPDPHFAGTIVSLEEHTLFPRMSFSESKAGVAAKKPPPQIAATNSPSCLRHSITCSRSRPDPSATSELTALSLLPGSCRANRAARDLR